MKISPDLADDEIDAIADLAVERQVDGIVAVNTTPSRAGLRSDPSVLERPGGVSGRPLKGRSLEVLGRLRRRAGNRLVLISVGGVETPRRRLGADPSRATLVQAYSGSSTGDRCGLGGSTAASPAA